MAVNEDTGIAAAENAGIKLSSPDKVLYPGQGVTKGKLAAYYASVAPAMMPYIANRPLSLVRCPAGRAKQCFFQKHDTGGFAQGMDTIEIEEKDGQADSYFTLDDLGGLLAGVQMGVLEFHIWGSRRDAIEKPDRIVFDIDPDEGLDFGNVKSAACDIRDRLGLSDVECAHVGDDLPDVALFEHVGLACAPADAHHAARKAAHFVSTHDGGRGAVRDVIDLLLAAKATP